MESYVDDVIIKTQSLKSLIEYLIQAFERIFGVWKIKWQILYKMPNYPIWKKKMIVVATMVLHNYIWDYSSGTMDFLRVERDEDYMPIIPKRYTK